MRQTNGSGGDLARVGSTGASGETDEWMGQRYEALVPLCVTSLVGSYDRRRHLFSHMLYEGAWREVDDVYPHETLTSSCIALLGLRRSGIDPADHGIDTAATLSAVVGEVGRTGYVGGIGMALWANAVADGERPAARVVADAGLDLSSLARDVVPSLTTMETAWLASGLLHELHRDRTDAVEVLARAVVEELRLRRFVTSTSLMNHAGPGASLLHRLRGHVANFADQIYSVQAFAFAKLVLDDDAALATGEALAGRHCDLQGPKGQWWWHYDARRGHVALRYAVYSVHQHGMAPMALRALAVAGGSPRDQELRSSLAWLDDNELGASMVDPGRSTIWRNVDRTDPSVATRARGALEAAGLADGRTPRTVRLNRETRPYEWAWCMYAAAIAAGIDPGRSVA